MLESHSRRMRVHSAILSRHLQFPREERTSCAFEATSDRAKVLSTDTSFKVKARLKEVVVPRELNSVIQTQGADAQDIIAVAWFGWYQCRQGNVFVI